MKFLFFFEKKKNEKLILFAIESASHWVGVVDRQPRQQCMNRRVSE